MDMRIDETRSHQAAGDIVFRSFGRNRRRDFRNLFAHNPMSNIAGPRPAIRRFTEDKIERHDLAASPQHARDTRLSMGRSVGARRRPRHDRVGRRRPEMNEIVSSTSS